MKKRGRWYWLLFWLLLSPLASCIYYLNRRWTDIPTYGDLKKVN